MRLCCTLVLVVVSGLLLQSCSGKQTKVSLGGQSTSTELVSSAVPAIMADTSDDATFEVVQLSSELQREILQNLRTIYFEYNSSSLSKEASELLAGAARYLRSHPTLRTLIEGHCDERGSPEYNLGLGENRARAVRDYLISLGVPRIQLEITSFGKEKPETVGCGDESCHTGNRRAEFRVLAR